MEYLPLKILRFRGFYFQMKFSGGIFSFRVENQTHQILESYDRIRKKKREEEKREKTGLKKTKKKPFWSIFPSRYSVFGAPFFKFSLVGDIFIQGGESNTPNSGILRSYPRKKRHEGIEKNT